MIKEEWKEWVEKTGTKNAPFQMLKVPDPAELQEFPVFHSKNPCGIYRTQSSTVGPFRRVTVREGYGSGKGAALVMELEDEDNLGHTLRSGTMLCSFLLKRQLEAENGSNPLPLTVFVWWTDESKRKLKYTKTMNYKLEMLRALIGGERVKYYSRSHGGEIQTIPEYHEFSRVYSAPWNGRDSREREWALAGGPLQEKYGEVSMRLSMSSVIVNRKPMKMFTGLSSLLKANLGVSDRSPTDGVVLLFQREVYDDPKLDPEEYTKNALKARLLVDRETGTPEGFLKALCNTRLPIYQVDFHPRSEAFNTFKEQLKLMAKAAVTVASHGSGLWNSIWMRPGSVTIEVTLRPGHCCMPIPKAMRNKTVCTEPCIPYKMVNIADGIAAAGVHWYYYDPLTLDFPNGDCNRATTRVYVDVQRFSKVLSGAYAVATGQARIDSKSPN
eukprot:CAMPEP_0184495698 /NCGR_PEP_ID=MMETSP0113_2-20130426/32081_1 /TAXON_ID=91329 /ORGANISM="Norrisiella sphaerica, Strain BC52" /LENGTH=440 /DNA_ID=CAMNT_0026882001 /DNA_START=450 /DNA_END=1772 /DNA_ORIENTATION=+